MADIPPPPDIGYEVLKPHAPEEAMRSVVNATVGLVREQLVQVLEARSRAAELWLHRHHQSMYDTVDKICAAVEQQAFSQVPTKPVSPAPTKDLVRVSQDTLRTDIVRATSAEYGSLAPSIIPRSTSQVDVQSVSPDIPERASRASVNSCTREGSPNTMAATWRTSTKSSLYMDRMDDTDSPSKLSLGGAWWKSVKKKKSNIHSGFVKTLTENASTPSKNGGISIRERLNNRVLQAKFDLFIGCLVVLNTIFMFVQLEVEAPSPDTQEVPGSHTFFVLAAHIFNGIFFVELMLKLYVKRCAFFSSAFNWIDAVIVVTTSFDTYVLSQIRTGKQNISFMRMVRFVRVVRALRVIRTMGLFRQLRVLLNTIAMSIMSLFWSMLIFFIFMLMFSLLLCQMLQPFVAESPDPEIRDWVHLHYGSSSRSLYTVFELTFSGCWPNYARPIIEKVDPIYAIFFIIYVALVVFAMVRIISALFLKDTLQTAANDAEMMVQEKTKEMKAIMNKLSELFEQADESRDGFLSREELGNIMSYPKVKVWMSVFGLDVTQTDMLFDMLEDGAGRISYDQFVGGIMRLKGTSRSQDTITIMRDCERICRYCEATQRACESVQQALGVTPLSSVSNEPSKPPEDTFNSRMGMSGGLTPGIAGGITCTGVADIDRLRTEVI